MALSANTPIITNGAPSNGIQHMKDSAVTIADAGDTTVPTKVITNEIEPTDDLLLDCPANKTLRLSSVVYEIGRASCRERV